MIDFENITNSELFSNFPPNVFNINPNPNFFSFDPFFTDSIPINNFNLINENNLINNDNRISNNNAQFNDNVYLETPFNFENEKNSSNNIENNIHVDSTNSLSNPNQVQDIHLKIFRIEKDNKKRGRIKKNTNYRGRHNKFSEDNIIRKIKGRFIEKCRIYINKEYKRYLLANKLETKKINELFQRIEPKFSRIIKRDDNLKWFRTQLYLVFSEDVSVKCSLYKPEYNKKQIEKIYKNNEAKNVIDILNKTVKEMFDAFILNKNIPGFDTLNDDIKELKEKMEKDKEENIDEYLLKYRNTALNLESIFINKRTRINNRI